MKKTLLIPLVLVVALIIAAFVRKSNPAADDSTTISATEQPAEVANTTKVVNTIAVSEVVKPELSDEIDWMSWDEAVTANGEAPKMLFIDLYTDWCGWCKVMDRQTFTDPKVIQYMNENFCAIDNLV